MIRWLLKQVGPEARLLRLEKEVARKERDAAFAEAELPLLVKKEKALDILNKRNDARKSIRQKQLARLDPDKSKKQQPFLKIKDPGSSYKVKTPIDRVYKN